MKKPVKGVKRIIIPALLIILMGTTSCKRCITCEVFDENNNIVFESEFCASGKDASKAIKDFEEMIKGENANVKCKESYW